MKNKHKKKVWVYLACCIITAVIMFSLNYILTLPAFIPIIGDENTWLPIIVDSILAGVIFFLGEWFANEDRLRNEIIAKKEDYKLICDSVCKVQSALNIKRKQLYFIYSLDVNMNSRTLLSEILQLQQSIEDSINSFEQIKYLVISKKELSEFEETYKILQNTFHPVLDGLMGIVNKWCDTQSKSLLANNVTEIIGGSSDKIKYANLYVQSCNELEWNKKKFLSTYYQQENNLNTLLNKLDKCTYNLLKAESKIITELESKI